MKTVDAGRAPLDVMKRRVPHEGTVAEHPDASRPWRVSKDLSDVRAALFVGHESDVWALTGANSRMVAAVEQAFAGDPVFRHQPGL
jgi:hypothetical protein